MASGSQNMTTYNARTVTGSNSAASPAGALLLSGAGRADNTTGDTWIFLDSAGGTSTPWGIKHDQANNKIQIFGAGTNSVWTQMNTGNTYIGGSLDTGSILTVRAQNDAHEGGEIILKPATDSFSTVHIDAYDSLFRLHDGTNERFKVNISSGNTTINGNLGIGTDYAVSGGSYKLYVNGSTYFNGNTTHNGIDYFANGTTYYINNSGDSRLRYEHANTYTGYDSAGFISSIAGSPWPYIRFDTRAGGSTYVTIDQTNWCQLYAQVPAKRDTTYYKTRFFFRQYSKTANTTTRLGYYEDYYLPETNDGRTGNAGYNILTTKDMSFSITGSAGSVAWSNVSSKPATATRWPAWNEISQSGANSLSEGTSNWTDNTEILTSYASNNGFADTNAKGVVYRRDAICAYNYIKNKASGTWSINITGSAGSVAWGNVSSKPATATRWPAWSEVTSKPSTFTPSSHTHTMSNITWTAPQNCACVSTANNQEWSFDMNPGSYTGTYWHVWSSKKGASCLQCFADDRHSWAYQLYGAVWNDYAEFRKAEEVEYGRVVVENEDKQMKLCNERLAPAAKVTSDTFGISIGKSKEYNMPIAVSGRVLVFPYQDRDKYKLGDAVCSAPGGTVDIMTRKEIKEYPERILGTVSEIPDYDIWYGGGENENDGGRDPVPVKGRIWIYVR